MVGGDDNDTLYGSNGDDELFGGAGVDDLFGERGSDRLNGGFGAPDDCDGGRGIDVHTGGCEILTNIP